MNAERKQTTTTRRSPYNVMFIIIFLTGFHTYCGVYTSHMKYIILCVGKGQTHIYKNVITMTNQPGQKLWGRTVDTLNTAEKNEQKSFL